MTGILPIKGDSFQSTISDFIEYTILDPDGFAEFTGFTAGDVNELCGKEIADVVYLPKCKSVLPALVIELKWNKSSEGAMEQIKKKHYPAVLNDYGGEIVIAGINYDAKTKEHSCVIERLGTI